MADNQEVETPISEAYFKTVGRIGDTPEAYRVRDMERALRKLTIVLRDRHHGRMPDDVQAAYDGALRALLIK